VGLKFIQKWKYIERKKTGEDADPISRTSKLIIEISFVFVLPDHQKVLKRESLYTNPGQIIKVK
jgi:hypothetical protein